MINWWRHFLEWSSKLMVCDVDLLLIIFLFAKARVNLGGRSTNCIAEKQIAIRWLYTNFLFS